MNSPQICSFCSMLEWHIIFNYFSVSELPTDKLQVQNFLGTLPAFSTVSVYSGACLGLFMACALFDFVER